MNEMKDYKKINNAVIDLGSNSIRMLIFRRNKEDQLFQVVRSLEFTNLMKDVAETGRLSEDAIRRNILALRDYQKIARDYEVHHVYVYATSAVREAKNSKELVNLVKDLFGLKVNIISGETEAEYGFYGVSQCFKGPILIFDIGGGSTELISGDHIISAKTSLNIGCVRSSLEFLPDQNIISLDDVKRFETYSLDKIKNSLEKFNLPKEFKLVGIGGTITTLASVIKKLPIYDSAQIHKTRLSYEQINNVLKEFINSDYRQRSKIVGLPNKRVDSITAGTIITESILKATRQTTCTVCDFDNMEGAAYVKFFLENPRDWDNQSYL